MTFRPNPAWQEQIQHTAEYHQGIGEICGQVAKAVRKEAPRKSGRYRNSITTFDTGIEQGVATTDVAGHIIEFGSVNNPPYAPFRRGTRAAGLRLDESPQ